MHNLLSWMEKEMTAHLCSGATIQKAGASPRSTVHLIGSNSPIEERGHAVSPKDCTTEEARKANVVLRL